jgi:hypothetical protein
MNGIEVRAEIARRRVGQTQRYAWISAISAALSALGAIVTLFHSR